MAVFHRAWGLWSFCGSVSQDMNPRNSLWVFCEDVRYTVSLEVFFLECEVSSLIVGVCCRTWDLWSDRGCMPWDTRSLFCVWAHFSDEVSVLFLPFYLSICFWSLCVCLSRMWDVFYLWLYVPVCEVPTLFVGRWHRTCASLLFWMYGQGWEVSDLLGIVWHGMWGLWATYAHTSQDGVFLIACGSISGVGGIKVPESCPCPNLWNKLKSPL